MHDDSIVLVTHGLLHQDVSSSQANIYGGHNYYNPEHHLVMQSQPNLEGGYNFTSTDGREVMQTEILSGQMHLSVNGVPETLYHNIYGGYSLVNPQTHTLSYTTPNIYHGQTLIEHSSSPISEQPNIFGGHSFFSGS